MNERGKAADAPNTSVNDRGLGHPGSILGNHVETEKALLGATRSAIGFRGDITLQPYSSSLDTGPFKRGEEVCSSKAIAVGPEGVSLDKGRCILCGMCQQAAPQAFKLVNSFAAPVTTRGELLIAQVPGLGEAPAQTVDKIGARLGQKIKKLLGRSLAIREVDAGSCNGCEVEVSALNNPIYDIERFGIHFVASPRHADVLLVTGVASRNLELALRRTYEATPDPKVVVAAGACACSGGIFGDTYASSGGIGKIVPVDVFVPGCPPRPEALLYGILLAVDRMGLSPPG
jgi:Ni,Fe-hydrogenase III small subunit/ferredoxin